MVSRSRKQNCWAITSTKKWTAEFVFLSWRLGNTWNLNFDFKFQIFPSRQDRKKNSFFHFLREVTVRQFCFEIYWPLNLRNYLEFRPMIQKLDKIIMSVIFCFYDTIFRTVILFIFMKMGRYGKYLMRLSHLYQKQVSYYIVFWIKRDLI